MYDYVLLINFRLRISFIADVLVKEDGQKKDHQVLCVRSSCRLSSK